MEVKELMFQVFEKQARIGGLVKEKTELVKNINENQESLSRAVSEDNKLKENIASRDSKVLAAQENLQSCIERMAMAGESVKGAESILEAAKVARENITPEISDASEKKVLDYKRKITSLNNKRDRIEGEISRISSDVNEVLGKLSKVGYELKIDKDKASPESIVL